MDEKTSNTGWVYFVAISFFALGLTIFLWKSDDTKTTNARKSASVSGSASVTASGIFIVPPGGGEVSRDTTGYRIALHNIGDEVVICARNPEALYLVDEDGEHMRIEGGQNTARVYQLGKKDYVIFVNFGSKTAKVKVRVISAV